MGVPAVSFQKNDFQTGSVPPSPNGVLAILACASTGTNNVVGGFARDDLMAAQYGVGPLIEFGSYDLNVSQHPVVLVKCNGSIAGAYGAIVHSAGTGTGGVTGDATVVPFDDYSNVTLVFTNGGTVGTPGITYQTSLDGVVFSATTALGSATSILIPNSGVQFDLTGSFLTGDTYTTFTSRPQPNNADVSAGLEALRVAAQPYEGILVDAVYGTGTVALLDTWLTAREGEGKFIFGLLNTRFKLRPAPTGETEAAYLAAMQALTSQDASIRICTGADGGFYTSTLTGLTQLRPTSMFLAGRAMLIPIGEDPAYVARGNLSGCKIASSTGNPKQHDEYLYPGLDALRLVTLRSFAAGGPQGVYITNANVESPTGSDYVWLQHIRTMNTAARTAWSILSGQLSIGVRKKAPDPVTNGVYIAEEDAQRIEQMVNAGFRNPLKGQVQAVSFQLSRTDDLSANNASTVKGTVFMVALAYLKNFQVTLSYQKSIAVSAV